MENINHITTRSKMEAAKKNAAPFNLIDIQVVKELEEFIHNLLALEPAPHEDIVAELYELIDPIENLPGAEEVIPEIFNFMEHYPDAELGSPGPLVHFIENFYPNYLEQLITSIERQPTQLTLWMLNRILNSKLSSEKRERLITVLQSVPGNPNASASAKSVAADFVAYQVGNG